MRTSSANPSTVSSEFSLESARLRSRQRGRSTCFRLGTIASVLAAMASSLLLRMDRLSGGHNAGDLAIQIQARGILDHACPVTGAPAPGGNTQLELFTGDAKQLQVLLGILEDAFFERNLGGRIDREGQWKMLLQRPDRCYRRVLLTRLRLGRRLALGGFGLSAFSCTFSARRRSRSSA